MALANDISAPLQHADREVVGGAPAEVLKEHRQHLLFALVEIERGVVRPLFDRHDAHAAARELPRRDRSARAGADDDRVGVDVDVGGELAAVDDRHVTTIPSTDARPTARRS